MFTAGCPQLYKEPFGWTESISTIVSTVGVVFVAQVWLAGTARSVYGV